MARLLQSSPYFNTDFQQYCSNWCCTSCHGAIPWPLKELKFKYCPKCGEKMQEMKGEND